MTSKQIKDLEKKGFSKEQILLIQEVLDTPPDEDQIWKTMKEVADRMSKDRKPMINQPIYIPVPQPYLVPYWPYPTHPTHPNYPFWC